MDKMKKYFSYTPHNQQFLMEFHDDIDGLLVNGNILAHYNKSIIAIINKYNFHTIVDPMFYIFQAQLKHQVNKVKGTNNKWRIKSSILKMLDNYGCDIAEISEKKFIKEELENILYDVLNIKNIEDLSLKTFDKINSEINLSVKNQPSILMQFLSRDRNININNASLIPQFIPNTDFWFKENIKILNKINIKNNFIIPIYIDKKSTEDRLYFKMLKYIQKHFRENEVLFWIEKNARDMKDKDIYLEILDFINENGIKASFRYANYNQLYKLFESNIKGLKWINAFGYGEERNILPIGGGLPTNKVYSTIQKKRLTFEDFHNEFTWKWNNKEDYLTKYCGCNVCKSLLEKHNNIKDDEMIGLFEYSDYDKTSNNRFFATKNAQVLSVRHYVYNKIKEIDDFNRQQMPKENISHWEKIILNL